MPHCEIVKLVNTPTAERDQLLGLPTTTRQDRGAQHSQRDDAKRVGQAITAEHELMRHVVVSGHEERKPREVAVGCIRGQHQDRHCCQLHAVVGEIGAAKNTTGDLAYHRFVAALGLVHRHCAILMRQECDTSEHHGQDADHPRQGVPGVLPFRLAERRHAIADCLHSRQRRASATECPQDQE